MSLIKEFLCKLGLNQNHSSIFLELMKQGKLTVLEISRASGISRSSVYRYVDELKGEGLIIEVIENGKKYYQTEDISNIERKINDQKSDIDFLENTISQIRPLFKLSQEIKQPGMKVQMYKGPDGIKQMMWNSLKTRGELLGYSFRSNREIVGDEFADKWRREFLKRKLKMRNLINYNYSKIANREIKEKQQGFETRVVPRNLLILEHQADIYNNVVAFYTWHRSKVFGMEIVSEAIASVQKQIFEIVWKVSS